MRSFSPMQAAVLEALRRRAALAIGWGILAILALAASLGTIFLAGVFLKIIFARFLWEDSELFPGSGAWQNETGAWLLVLCIAVTAWDILRLTGGRKGEAIVVAKRKVTQTMEPPSWRPLMWLAAAPAALAALFAAPFGFALARVMISFGLDSSLGIALPVSKDPWVFPPRLDDCLDSPIRRALSAVAPVLIRMPLWAIMAASICILLLFGFFTIGALVALAVTLACGIAPFAAVHIIVSELIERTKKRAAAREAEERSFKERLAAWLQKLASEAPHALAAAEAKALEKTSRDKAQRKKALRE